MRKREKESDGNEKNEGKRVKENLREAKEAGEAVKGASCSGAR